jgi:predicted extracellular nuclease
LRLKTPAALLLALAAASPSAFPQARVVISQIYGGGGNSGATLKNDFIELFNSGDAAQNLAGWSVQYTSSAGTTWTGAGTPTPLTGTIQPGHYFLVQEAAGANVNATPLPSPDVTGTIPMSATAGKVALVSATAALTGSCPTANIVDFVGYGTGTNCFEGTAIAPLLANTTARRRGMHGQQQ